MKIEIDIHLEALVIGAIVGIIVGWWTYITVNSGGFSVLFGFIATGLVTWLLQKLFFNDEDDDNEEIY